MNKSESAKTTFYRDPLWNRLVNEVLPFVQKPGRYVGNELNSIHKIHDDNIFKVALCFPDMYEIGMSYLGMQILYHLVNRRSDALAERVFAVWPDMEKRLNEKNIPLFSLESSTPVAQFDIMGFHITYEMSYVTVLSMLNLAGIPFKSSDRNNGHPIVIAGGPSTLNPEPVADFIDAIFIGDAEEAIYEIIDALKEAKSKNYNRKQKLEMLSKIGGMYIPGYYSPKYYDDGNFISLEKIRNSAPDKIKTRSIAELKSEYYADKPIVPFVEITQDHLSCEIMRGCVRGCRFCQAGYQYRPRRQRAPEEITSSVFANIESTGYDDVTLLSLSSTDYDRLNDLLARLGPKFIEKKIGLGLPSLRPETITPSLLETLSATRKSGLTLAPEAGTERLRNSLGKKISDEEIYNAIRLAMDAGWQTFKLYFMIGLPGETDDDLEGIIAILRKTSYMAFNQQGKCTVNVTLSSFNPKPHTPWQWERRCSNDDINRKIQKIIKGVRKPNINIKYGDLNLSLIESVFSRGDRRLSNAILNAYNKGARLEGWTEWFNAERWYQSFKEAGIDCEKRSEAIDDDASLPWDHIDNGISKEYLKKDNHKSKEAIPSPSVFDHAEKKLIINTSEDSEFGRRAKRAAKQSTAPPGTYKIRIKYSRNAEIRFYSHLDMIRTLTRAINRSEIPIAFSEGFNPHMKVSFGTPLPLGYTSEAEYLDIQTTQPCREEFIINLQRTLPIGLEIMGYKHYFANVASLSKQLNFAIYEIPEISNFGINPVSLKEIVDRKNLLVKRKKENIEKEVDAGPFIENLEIDNKIIIAGLWQTQEGHIKPEEILTFGLGLDNEKVKPLQIHRKGQYYKSGFRLIEPLELV